MSEDALPLSMGEASAFHSIPRSGWPKKKDTSPRTTGLLWLVLCITIQRVSGYCVVLSLLTVIFPYSIVEKIREKNKCKY